MTTPPNLPKRPSGVVAVDGQVQGSLTTRVSVDGLRVNFANTGEDRAFRDLCAGRIDVADAARRITAAEQRACDRAGIALAPAIQVASDAVVVATRNESDVGGDCLRLSTVRDIFRAGSPIGSWDQVGFDPIPMRTTGRDQDANVFQFFAAEVLGIDPRTASLADLRSDYRVHRSDDEVRKDVTNESRIEAVRARYAPTIRRLEREAAARRRRELRDAAARARRRVLNRIAAENADRARRQVTLTTSQKRAIRTRNARRVRDAIIAAQNRVLANFATPELTHQRRLLRSRLNAAQLHGTVGYFRFSYYELYENLLRPLEIWDPATARQALKNAGVEVAGDKGAPRDAVNPETTPWCVFPSQITVTNGSYPLARPFLLYTTRIALRRAEVRSFLNTYVNNAQELATSNRLVPIPDTTLADNRDIIAGRSPGTTRSADARPRRRPPPRRRRRRRRTSPASRSRARPRPPRPSSSAIVGRMSSSTISFARGAPSLDIVDVEGLRAAADRVFSEDPAGATGYGTSVGYPPLRRWIAERHGVEESQVIVTNGSMQADAFIFDELVGEGDDVVVERPTYDRTLKSLRERGANVHMVTLEADGIDVASCARSCRTGAAEARARDPQLPEPRGVHALAGQARGAARARARPRLRHLRGRPVRRAAVPWGDAAADGRPRRRARRGGLRQLVLQDRLPGHPRGLPRRPDRAHRAHRGARDERLHLAQHGRAGDRPPVLRQRGARALDRDRQGGPRRARRGADDGAGARHPRGALRRARRRLLHVGRAARGHERRRAVRRRRGARGAVRQGHRLPHGGRREHAAPRLLGRHPGRDRRGRRPAGRGAPLGPA